MTLRLTSEGIAMRLGTVLVIVLWAFQVGYAAERNGPPPAPTTPPGLLPGSPKFLPTAEHPQGWRGDGTGQYPGATPPLSWERVLAGPLGNGRQQAGKPKGDEPGPDAVDLTAGHPMVTAWLILGPFAATDTDPKNALSHETVPGEATLAGEEGVKVNDQRWKTGWFTTIGEMTDAEGKANGFWTAPNQVAYAHTYLYFRDAGSVDVSIQHEGGLKIWVNGKAAYEEPKTYKYAYGRMACRWFTVPVAKGWNRLLCKLTRTDKESWCGAKVMPTKVSTYTTKAIQWIAPMPNLSNSNPLVVGDRVFTTSEPNDLICLDAKTGKVQWVRSVLSYYAAMEDKYAGIDLEQKHAEVNTLEALNASMASDGRMSDSSERIKLATSLQEWLGKTKEYNYHVPGWGGGNSVPTPCTDGEYIYAWYGEAGILGCYGLDGTRRWVRYIHPIGAGDGNHHGVNGSPVISGDRIVIPGWGCFLGVERMTGKLMWTSKYEGTAFSTHATTRIGDTDAIILPTGRIMRSTDGTILTPDLKSDGHVSTGIDRDRDLFSIITNSGDMAIGRIPKDLASKEAQIVCTVRRPAGEGFEGSSHSSPLMDDGLFYWVSARGVLHVANIATGETAYTKRLPLYPFNAFSTQGAGVAASLCKAGGNIYILDNRGTVVVVAPGREYKLLAINRIQDIGPNSDQEVFNATPVFAGSCVYIRGYRNLYCIGEPDDRANRK